MVMTSYPFKLGLRLTLVPLIYLAVFLAGSAETNAVEGKSAATGPAPVLVDFEADFEPLAAVTPASRITGSLPASLRDDSGWAGLDIHYAPETATLYSGKQSLRMKVSNVTKGWAQLTVPGLPLDLQHFTKISAAFLAPGASKVTLYLRKHEYPFTTYWEQSFDVRPEWRPFEFLIPPVVEDPQALLTITTKSEGDLLIDDLSVSFPSAESIGQNSPARKGNQMPVSSFPLGLAGQWSVQHGRHGLGRAFADTGVPGPTGVAALQFGVGGEKPPYVNTGARLVSPAFSLNGGRPHGVGLYIKGSQSEQVVQLSLLDPWSPKNAMSRVFKVGTDWQWISMTGDLPYSMRGYYNLSISTGERAWIDGITVTEGKGEPAFARSCGVEISLRAKKPYALYFPDEVFECDLAAVGQTGGVAKYEATLTDPSGNAIPLDPGELAGDCPVKKLTIPLRRTKNFGTYLLTIRAVGKEGEALSHSAELAFHRVHHPRKAGVDAPDSPFGIHINPTPAEARMVKELGFNWVRVHDGGQEVTGWYFLEPSPGQFDFTYSDRAIEILRGQNLRILGMLNMAPPFYTDCPANYSEPGHTRQYFVVRNDCRSKWQDYVRRIVSRNTGKIDEWEVMNEPYAGLSFFIKKAEKQGSGSYRMTAGTAENYVQLFGDAFTAAKEANPGAKLVWMMNHETGWNDRCIRAGITDFCDIASYHYYLVGNPLDGFPETKFSGVAHRLKSELQAAGKDQPFWNTEASAANLQVPWKSSPAFEVGECEKMANALVRCYVSFLGSGSKKWFLYSAHIFSVWAPFYYGFTAPDGTLAPAATALSTFMWLAEDKVFDRAVPVGEGVFAFIFSGDSGSIGVLASNRSEPLVLKSLPEGWKLLDRNGNPVWPSAAPFSRDNVKYIVFPHRAGEDEWEALSSLRLLPAG